MTDVTYPYIGVSISGLELTGWSLNNQNAKTNPAYFGGLGCSIMRIPFSWEQTLPKLGSATPSSSYLTNIQNFTQAVLDTGAVCLLDMHSYAKYGGTVIDTTGQVSGAPQIADLTNAWRAVANLPNVKNNPMVRLGIANEPGLATATWAVAHNACVAALRAAGITNTVHFMSQGGGYATNVDQYINDPNTIYEIHQYYNSTGQFAKYDGTKAYDLKGAYPLMIKRLTRMILGDASRFKICIGEMGWDTGAVSLADVAPMLAEAVKDRRNVIDSLIFWGGGSEFPSSYIYCMNALSNGQDLPIWSKIKPFLKNPAEVVTRADGSLISPVTSLTGSDLSKGIEIRKPLASIKGTSGNEVYAFDSMDGSTMIPTTAVGIYRNDGGTAFNWTDGIGPFDTVAGTNNVLAQCGVDPFNEALNWQWEQQPFKKGFTMECLCQFDPTDTNTSHTAVIGSSDGTFALWLTSKSGAISAVTWVTPALLPCKNTSSNTLAKFNSMFGAGKWTHLRVSVGPFGLVFAINNVPMVTGTAAWYPTVYNKIVDGRMMLGHHPSNSSDVNTGWKVSNVAYWDSSVNPNDFPVPTKKYTGREKGLVFYAPLDGDTTLYACNPPVTHPAAPTVSSAVASSDGKSTTLTVTVTPGDDKSPSFDIYASPNEALCGTGATYIGTVMSSGSSPVSETFTNIVPVQKPGFKYSCSASATASNCQPVPSTNTYEFLMNSVLWGAPQATVCPGKGKIMTGIFTDSPQYVLGGVTGYSVHIGTDRTTCPTTPVYNLNTGGSVYQIATKDSSGAAINNSKTYYVWFAPINAAGTNTGVTPLTVDMTTANGTGLMITGNGTGVAQTPAAASLVNKTGVSVIKLTLDFRSLLVGNPPYCGFGDIAPTGYYEGGTAKTGTFGALILSNIAYDGSFGAGVISHKNDGSIGNFLSWGAGNKTPGFVANTTAHQITYFIGNLSRSTYTDATTGAVVPTGQCAIVLSVDGGKTWYNNGASNISGGGSAGFWTTPTNPFILGKVDIANYGMRVQKFEMFDSATPMLAADFTNLTGTEKSIVDSVNSAVTWNIDKTAVFL